MGLFCKLRFKKFIVPTCFQLMNSHGNYGIVNYCEKARTVLEFALHMDTCYCDVTFTTISNLIVRFEVKVRGQFESDYGANYNATQMLLFLESQSFQLLHIFSLV